MLEYLIKITTNTFSSVVPAALLMAAVYSDDRQNGKTYLSRGFLTGLLAALVYSVLKRNTGFAVREYYDLGALLPSLAAGAVLLLDATLPRGVPDKARAHIPRAAVFLATASWTAYAAPNILLYPFDFAVGMDNIYNADFMLRAAGYSLALILMFVVAWTLFRMASGTSNGHLRAAFFLSLLALLSENALSVMQILLGRNMIPRHPRLTGAVMWALTHENAFLYVFMFLAALLSLAGIATTMKQKPTGENPAQIRKKKFLARRQLKLCLSVLTGAFLSLLIATVGVSYANRKVELSPPLEIPASGGRIFIPLETVSDGDLHRFVHKVEGEGSATDVRYIIIRKNETSYGVGFDACDVCGASGYFQRKGQVVCILCDVVMNKSTIGLPGGCNPVPLAFAVESGGIVIATDDLEAEAYRFY
ncbi:MAG: Fe-S-containing protein [Synergistaceae bacterium]|jgi:uncharacterized membrane protein|nr:Fe-S-containing protein [Synergistaceae bacterium]